MTMYISAKVKLITINYKQKWLLLIHVVKKSSEHLNIILDDLILLLFKRSHLHWVCCCTGGENGIGSYVQGNKFSVSPLVENESLWRVTGLWSQLTWNFWEKMVRTIRSDWMVRQQETNIYKSNCNWGVMSPGTKWMNWPQKAQSFITNASAVKTQLDFWS